MSEMPIEIRPFDITGASVREFAALNRHLNQTTAETLPDDPSTPLDERIAQMRNIPSSNSVHVWAGWNKNGTEIVAGAYVAFLLTDGNAHLAPFDVHVEPDYRRQGIGRELFRRLVETAHRSGRSLMTTETNERVPAGEAFMRHLGAERGAETHTSQLLLSEVDPALIGMWQAGGQERAPGFTLGFWDRSCPEDRFEAMAALMNVRHKTPREDLDVLNVYVTPNLIRQREQMLAATGAQQWTVYAIETAIDRLVGFTEINWNPNRPQIVAQGGTAVLPEVQGRGLGRWLKAAMLNRILRDRPTARFIRTGNADSNAAMLGINQALGFKPYISHCVWQLAIEKARAYLDGSPA